MNKTLVVIAGACVVALSASSCASGGIYSIPLPGGASLGNNPLTINLQFDDVLDLVPQSTVKVDGVAVGRVDSISVPNDGWTADVKVLVNSSVDLPADAMASVQQTNILGEKFIQLAAPDGDTTAARLTDGATIPIERTRHATDIEQVLGALSLLLNGGGVGQLSPIIKELSTALNGREGKTRDLLEQANTLIDGLNKQRDDITRALDGLDTLSGRVSTQTAQIDKVLTDLPIATDVLNQQRPQLVSMLSSLDRLGQVGTNVIDQSKDNLIADLRALRPTLQALAGSADDIVSTLPFVLTFPFPDGFEKIAQGNSANLYLSLDLQIGTALNNFGVGKPNPVYLPPKYGNTLPLVDASNPYYNGNGARPGFPTISLLPILPTIPNPVPAPGVPGGPPVGTPPSNPIQDLLKTFGVGQ